MSTTYDAEMESNLNEDDSQSTSYEENNTSYDEGRREGRREGQNIGLAFGGFIGAACAATLTWLATITYHTPDSIKVFDQGTDEPRVFRTYSSIGRGNIYVETEPESNEAKSLSRYLSGIESEGERRTEESRIKLSLIHI